MKTSAKVSMRLKILAFIFFILCTVTSVHGREFFCPGADATCLITAINEANNNGEENTIFLESGEYVTEPISIMGPFPLTIIGQGRKLRLSVATEALHLDPKGGGWFLSPLKET